MKATIGLCFALAAATLISFAAVAESSMQRAPGNVPAPGAKYISRTPAADGQLGMALLAAFVDGTATLSRGAGATGAQSLGTGQFVVTFNRDVSQCFYSGNSFLEAVIVDLEPRTGDPDSVFLEVRNLQGNLVNDEFYLTVFCAR